MAKRKLTQRAIGRKSFEKAYAKKFNVSPKVAREARRLFEKHTLEDATKKLLTAHPRIAKSKVAPAKAAVTRKENASGVIKEFICSLTYQKGRTFDVIVTAHNSGEAKEILTTFLENDLRGRRIVRAEFRGWDLRIAEGEKSDEEAGEAEYRGESVSTKK
jgi:hypothetical protein